MIFRARSYEGGPVIAEIEISRNLTEKEIKRITSGLNDYSEKYSQYQRMKEEDAKVFHKTFGQAA